MKQWKIFRARLLAKNSYLFLPSHSWKAFWNSGNPLPSPKVISYDLLFTMLTSLNVVQGEAKSYLRVRSNTTIYSKDSRDS
jgi:hypothetical protein